MFWLYNFIILFIFIGIFIYFIKNILVVLEKKYTLSFIDEHFLIKEILSFDFVCALLQIGICMILMYSKAPIKKVFKGESALITDIATKILLLYTFAIIFVSGFIISFSTQYVWPLWYIIGYLALTTGALSWFLLFFLMVVSDDPGYKKAKPYFYKINEMNYEAFKNNFIQSLHFQFHFDGTFKRKSYAIEYYISQEDYNYIFAFLHLKTLSSSLANYYYNEGIFSFGEYLNSMQQINLRKKTRIVYFFVVDHENNAFTRLANASVNYQSQFNVIHALVNLEKQELYVGSMKSKAKTKLNDYNALKDIITTGLSKVIDERYGDLNEKDM